MKRDVTLDKKKWSALGALLGLAFKAGKLKFGMSAAYQSCEKKRARLVLIARDLSGHSLRKIMFVMTQQGIKSFSCGTKEEFGLLFKRNDTGLIIIEDQNFAAGIEKILI